MAPKNPTMVEAFIWLAAPAAVTVVEVGLAPTGINVLVCVSWEVGGGEGASVGTGSWVVSGPLDTEVDMGSDTELVAGEGGGRESLGVFEPEAVPLVAEAPLPDPVPAAEVLPGETVVAEALTEVVIEPVDEPVAEPLADEEVAVRDADEDEEDLTGSQVKSKRDLVETVVPTIPN